MTPWTDLSGKFSPLKATVLAGACLPALWLAWQALTGALVPATPLGLLGARPITEAIHQTGDWAIRFLWLSLAVTPLRRIANWPKLIMVRRMLGVTALCYALTHLTLYTVDLKLDLLRVVSEIALRFYLTIGFVALLGLITLGSTSTDAAIKRLGRNWNRLHKIVYVIGVLAAFHFFIQSKADVYEPTLMAGFFLLLMFYRLAHCRGFSLTSPLVLVAVAILAALGTAAIEYAWYGIATGVPPGRVLAANLQFSFSIRPAWWVLATGLGATLLALVRPWFGRQEPVRGRRAARAAA
jgi:sulfoxide reductase heme-binding subunit YedZ